MNTNFIIALAVFLIGVAVFLSGLGDIERNKRISCLEEKYIGHPTSDYCLKKVLDRIQAKEEINKMFGL